MALDFYKTTINDETILRGPARLLWAGITIAMPTTISGVVNLSLFTAAAGWNDLGGTKTGVAIERNNTEQTIDIDQIYTDLDAFPQGWSLTVQTSLSEMNLENVSIAWQGSPVTSMTAEGAAVTQKRMGLGAPIFYIRRRLAVVHQKSNGLLRAIVLRRVNRSPQASALTHDKAGDQLTTPVRFEAFADLSVSDVDYRFGEIWDQAN